MRKIRYYVGLDYVGADHEEIVEFSDDTSDTEIDECFESWRDNYLDSGWEEIEEDDTE